MIKKILVYTGKYDPTYIDASTTELEALAYRKLFKLMDDMGYYQSDYSEENLKRFDKEIEDAQKSVDQLSGLEQTTDIAKLLETSETKLKRLLRNKKENDQDSKDYQKIKEDVDNVDFKTVRRFLYSRVDYEYESFYISKLY